MNKYIWSILTLIYIWVVFYIGANILSLKFQWYALPYVYTAVAGFAFMLWVTLGKFIK